MRLSRLSGSSDAVSLTVSSLAASKLTLRNITKRNKYFI